VDLLKLLAVLALPAMHQQVHAEPQSTSTFPTCPPISVPADSLVLKAMGSQLVVYPSAFPRNFSGCAYSWLGNDTQPYSRARFEGGKLVEGIIADPILPPTYCRIGAETDHPEYCEAFRRFWTDAFRDMAEPQSPGVKQRL
jgi:hypothetical protein